jgi:hypothetical protein
MQACWDQIGDVLAINYKILLGQLAKEVSWTFFQKHFATLSDDRQFLMTAPVQKRIVTGELTVYGQVQKSTLPYAATTGAFRRIIRPGSAMIKRLSSPAGFTPATVISQLNDQLILAAPPKTAPPGAVKLADAVAKTDPTDIPQTARDLLTKHPAARYIPLISTITLLIALLLTGGAALALMLVLIVALAVLYYFANKWYKALNTYTALDENNQTPEAVDELPHSPNFTISAPGETTPAITYGTTDSVEAVRFKQALKDIYTFTDVHFDPPVKTKLDLPKLTADIRTAIDPLTVIPKRILAGMYIPPHIRERLVETFAPVMNYPKIDLPMYFPLSKISAELFLPNINLVENNSISLLEMNEKFIEAYMVGLNHEMARELLWREYPTDQKGSYFRQFWDVSAVYPGNPPPADVKESLRDIKEIHTWPKTQELGTNSNRQKPGDKPPIVLVIRGDLFKKYPRPIIYAHKAEWGKKDGGLDASVDRVLSELTPDEEKDPPKSKIRTPMLEAEVGADIRFFGFNLTAEEVNGGTTIEEDAGWFFVIKERPGEARFGLDEIDNEPGAPKLYNWNKLSWENTATPDGKCLRIDGTFNLIPQPAVNPNAEDLNEPEDTQAKWDPNTDAAQLAYILYQVPMMVAVHASKMLPHKP